MKILEILQKEEVVFVEDAISGKKTSALVDNVNKSFVDMAKMIVEFRDYAQSQLKGEGNRKIVMSKSLINYYPTFPAIKVAHEQVAQEEINMIAKYNAVKANLINNLNNLLKASQKDAVVSLYDIFASDYQKCKEGHEIIILGEHNKDIIQNMINVFETCLVVSGNYEKVLGKELSAKYSKVETNVKTCYQIAHKIYEKKAGKFAKVDKAIQAMREIGKQVVFFETYVNDMMLIGVKEKDIQAYRKGLEKQYMPLKKTLQKDLKVNFVDICDLVADENEYNEVDLDGDAPISAKPIEFVDSSTSEINT